MDCVDCIVLRAEKEELKLKLFWFKYGVSKLQQAMAWANQKEINGVGCNCLACAMSGRKDEDNGITGS